jgi:urea transporter
MIAIPAFTAPFVLTTWLSIALAKLQLNLSYKSQ